MARRSSGSGLGIVLLIIIAVIASVPKEVWIGVAILTLVGFVLYSLLKGQAKPSSTVRTLPAERSPVSARQFSSEKPQLSVTSASCWVPAGKEVLIARLIIPGGMLYVGSGLVSVSGSGIEPALINPTLPMQMPTGPVDRMDYWPSYSNISPTARGGYLNWLAGGRKDPDVQTGYVFLFFYGLERRVLADSRQYKEVREEIPAILAEVRRLLSIYGSNGSFYGYANSFLDMMETVETSDRVYKLPPPPPGPYKSLTMRHKIALGQAAVDGRPLPAEWAYSWLVNEERIFLRTPAQRCETEFKKLFVARYAERFGEGIKLPVNKTKLKGSYRPASASFGYSHVELTGADLPDVTVLEGPVNKLREISELTTAQIEPYSRYLGKNPDKQSSVDALVLLPLQLWPAETVENLKAWLRHLGADKGLQVTGLHQLVQHFPGWEGRSKDRFAALASALENLGIGMEPDVRWGGRVPSEDLNVVLFPISGDENDSKPSALYAATTLTLHLAAAVAASDGEVSPVEAELVEERLASCFSLTPAERVRLRAHLRWLLLTPPPLNALKKRVSVLTDEQKRVIAAFLIGVAQIAGSVSPEEVIALTKIYRLFGLQEKDLYSDLHAAATEPVTVTPAALGTGGFDIPPRPVAKPIPGIILDQKRIAALTADSERVSALLGTIFSEEEKVPDAPALAEPEAAPAVFSIAGLDTGCSELVRVLLSRDTWKRAELEDLASDRSIMLDGALERINEAFLDAYNQPLFEGEDPVEINKNAVKGLEAA